MFSAAIGYALSMFQSRLKLLRIVFLLLFAVVLLRLADLQILRRGEVLARAAEVEGHPRVLPAIRGSLFDRGGRPLARDRCGYEVQVFPSRFRRRSLIYAIRDLRVLLDPELGPMKALLEVSGEAGEGVARLLQAPADSLPRSRRALRAAMAPLSSSGDLLISWRHRDPRARLRELLAVLRGAGRGISGTEAAQILGDPRPLGVVLGVDIEPVLARLSGESRSLLRLARELGFDGLPRLLYLLESLSEKERRWVDFHVEREFRQAVCLSEVQSPRFTPSSVGAKRYLAAARRLATPAEGELAAAAWLRGVSAILAGSIPSGPPPEESATGEAVAKARAAGWVAVDEVSVTAAFCREAQERGEGGRDQFLSKYRDRQVRRRLVGGRSFLVGRGARPWILKAIEGEGGLRDIGFRVKALFVRDQVLGEDLRSARLLIGELNSRGDALSGVEARLDERLRGVAGAVYHDGDGRVVRSEAPRDGEDIRLSLDLELQRELEGVLTQAGGIAVVDVASGGILALTTHPAPAVDDLSRAVAERLDLENRRRELRPGSPPWWELTSQLLGSPAWHRSYEHPLHCPPGSVFKPFTLLCGLKKGVIDQNTVFDCPPRGRRHRYSCHGHGLQDVIGTIEVSCNNFCYETGLLVGVDALVETLDELGYFAPVPGLLWQDRFLKRGLLADRDVRSLSIGMGTLHCSPVRAAGLMASLASGVRVVPTLLAEAKMRDNPGPIATEQQLSLIRRGLELVVSGRGTARRVRSLDKLRAAGKTGTADFKRLGLNQAWFAGYAPREAPRYAVAVLLEFTTLQGSDAARVAGEVLQTCGRVLGEW